MSIPSAIYRGVVSHRRLKPKRHALRYRIFYLLLDLDEVDGLAGRLRLFSRNGFNLLSFHDRDHLAGSEVPLRTQVEAELKRAGIEGPHGAITLLSMPRVLGAAFNPLSVYFCHDPAGRLVAVLYEVNNTFGQRHSYLIPADGFDGAAVVQECAKQFYVSPFMDMNLTYGFRVTQPGESLSVGVDARDPEGPIIATAFAGRRSALTDLGLLRSFLAHPLLALKVLGGIHWEALRIWTKGIKLRPRPPAPAEAVTIVQSGRTTGQRP